MVRLRVFGGFGNIQFFDTPEAQIEARLAQKSIVWILEVVSVYYAFC